MYVRAYDWLIALSLARAHIALYRKLKLAEQAAKFTFQLLYSRRRLYERSELTNNVLFLVLWRPNRMHRKNLTNISRTNTFVFKVNAILFNELNLIIILSFFFYFICSLSVVFFFPLPIRLISCDKSEQNCHSGSVWCSVSILCCAAVWLLLKTKQYPNEMNGKTSETTKYTYVLTQVNSNLQCTCTYINCDIWLLVVIVLLLSF